MPGGHARGYTKQLGCQLEQWRRQQTLQRRGQLHQPRSQHVGTVFLDRPDGQVGDSLRSQYSRQPRRAGAVEQAKNLAEKLSEVELIFAMKVGEKGKLFGSVNQKQKRNKKSPMV